MKQLALIAAALVFTACARGDTANQLDTAGGARTGTAADTSAMRGTTGTGATGTGTGRDTARDTTRDTARTGTRPPR